MDGYICHIYLLLLYLEVEDTLGKWKTNHVNQASKSSNLKEAVTVIDRSAKTGSSLQAA